MADSKENYKWDLESTSALARRKVELTIFNVNEIKLGIIL